MYTFGGGDAYIVGYRTTIAVDSDVVDTLRAAVLVRHGTVYRNLKEETEAALRRHAEGLAGQDSSGDRSGGMHTLDGDGDGDAYIHEDGDGDAYIADAVNAGRCDDAVLNRVETLARSAFDSPAEADAVVSRLQNAARHNE